MSTESHSTKVCVVTGSRADYGLLRPVMEKIRSTPGLRLQIIALGSHFLESQGNTFRVIEDDGFTIDERVPGEHDDSMIGVAEGIATGVVGCCRAFTQLSPDISLLLGDRYEILAAAVAATVVRLPIAHVAGGDVTEGAYDEGFRHAITKLAHLHFPTSQAAADRIKLMGEEDWRVVVSGSPGIDGIRSLDALSRSELEDRLAWRFHPRNIVVTYHPTTLLEGQAKAECDQLVRALEELPPDVGVVVTGSNSDSDGSVITKHLKEYCHRSHGRAIFVTSLGQQAYLSLLGEVDAVVGNSSSGLYEAPSLGTPTVDIGLRQEGRMRAESVIWCDIEHQAIREAVLEAIGRGRVEVANPYGDGYASERIVAALLELPYRDALLHKRFMQGAGGH